MRTAVQRAYGLDHLPSQQEVLSIAEKRRPFRSLATTYLFAAACDPEPAVNDCRLGRFSVSPIGFGAMRLTGPHVSGPPRDHANAVAVL